MTITIDFTTPLKITKTPESGYAAVQYTLTSEQLEQAYREKLHSYLLQDAEEQLADYYDAFEETWGFDYQEAVHPDNPHYLLDELVDQFERCRDCNNAENATWESVIQSLERNHITQLHNNRF